MFRQRIRIRFAKIGDLRLISHRDVVRLFERMLRRAQVPLAMSEGFHPRPLMTFPVALALGVQACDEVMEVVVAQPMDASNLQDRLQLQTPDGLAIKQVRILNPKNPKARAEQVTYEVSIPAEHHHAAREAIDQLMRRESLLVERERGKQSIDVRQQVVSLALQYGMLKMCLRLPSAGGTVRPSEILEVLQLDDMTAPGCSITRTSVELVS